MSHNHILAASTPWILRKSFRACCRSEQDANSFYIDIAQNLCCESDTRTSEFDREVRFLLDKGVFDVSGSKEMAVLPEAPHC